MNDHPAWCQQSAGCTAHDGPAPSLRRAHRGAIAVVETDHGAKVTTMLVQDHPDGQPEIVIVAAGWAQSRMVDLGTAGVQQLIDNLTEQLAAARRTVEARR